MTKKKQLSREGQLGLVLLIMGMGICVAAGELLALIGLFCGLGGFYILTHQDSFKLPSFSKR